MRISYVNGRYLPHSAAMVHIEDRGYQFADGAYEYIAFYNGVFLDGELHWQRFARSLRELHINFSVAALPFIARELIERNHRTDGGLYVQVTRGVARRDHPFPKGVKPSVAMTVCPPKTPKPQDVEKGIKVITRPDIRWGRCDIKSISLLPNILAKQEAAKKQAREAWLVGEDLTVYEGAASNAYIVTSRGEIVTHHNGEHILGGITRDVVLALARMDGIPVAERAFNLVEMKEASEAFMTSTSANVLPVVQIDETTIGTGKVGPVTRKLQKLYAEHIFQQTGKHL